MLDLYPEQLMLCFNNKQAVACISTNYFGLIKVSAQSHLKAMCLNLLKAANRLSVPAAA